MMKKNNIQTKNTKNSKAENKCKWSNIYYVALIPLLSIVLYLGMMVAGLIDDDVNIALSIAVLVLASGAWGACGFLFSRSRATMFASICIGNAIPLMTTVIYVILYIVSTLNGSLSLADMGSVIGGLGTGLFGFAGTLFYALAPFELEFLQVFVSFAFQIIVFVVGFSIGISRANKKAKKKTSKKK